MKTFATSAVAAAALAAFATAAHADVSVNANIELDTTYVKKDASLGTSPGFTQTGRVEFNALGKATASSDYFVAGRGTLLLGKSGGATTDDMWVQAGSSTFDVKLGRFEAVDLFPLGKDVVVEKAGDHYNANTLRGRVGDNVFHGAMTLKAGSGLSFELGLIEAKNSSLGDPTDPTDTRRTTKGIRPVVTFSSGGFVVKAGVEAIKYKTAATTTVNRTGFGLSVGGALSGMNFNANLAMGKDASDFRQTALGLNGTMGPFGAGLIFGKNEKAAGVEDDKITTVYAAYTFPLFDIKGASVTPAVSFSKLSGATDGDVAAVRVRVNYAF
jgi:hypothetical protein